MQKIIKNKANIILEKIINHYPEAKIELDYNKKDIWQLLVVVILSAQATDKKVNEISPKLFEKFKTIQDFAKADIIDIENKIKAIGLYKNKAKNLKLAAQKILTDFDGRIPHDRKLLETIPGVGQKTSAVVLLNAFNEPLIAVDTHVFRVSKRLGFSLANTPNLMESELENLFRKELISKAHHALIFHGRRICKAKKPLCDICPVNDLCIKNELHG